MLIERICTAPLYFLWQIFLRIVSLMLVPFIQTGCYIRGTLTEWYDMGFCEFFTEGEIKINWEKFKKIRGF